MWDWMMALEMVGTVAFAISGAVTALKKHMDLFGVVILGLTAAVGGGVIRDLLLGNTPPVTFREPVYALTAILTGIVVFIRPVRGFLMGSHRITGLLLLISDSVGLAVFTVNGVQVAFSMNQAYSLFLIVFVGVVTGVGGGVIRDMMAGDTPYIFVKHVYASAALVGAVLCALLWGALGSTAAMLIGAAVIFLIRLLSA
ncbi:MAG: TRIC cation channel family protein, partial [Clostridia bacterium]|nr:TRIC cation channel family protein [Clostridia bacterium]